jgi:hypothetical protein
MTSEVILCQAPVAHACNPSYSGGRDQEDCSLKPASANSVWDPTEKKSWTKERTGGMTQGVGPEFKLSTAKQTNEKLFCEEKLSGWMVLVHVIITADFSASCKC